MLRAIRESGGGAVAIEDVAMAKAVGDMGECTGIFACPEGGAVLAAVPELTRMGLLSEDDETVLFNTGSGLKYVGMTPME